MAMTKGPRDITEVKAGATYKVPQYYINQDGVNNAPDFELRFCKGNKDNPGDFRQEGFFTESLLEVAKAYLESVNIGDMKTHETSMAIDKIVESIMWLKKRADDRVLRQVQNTYLK